MDRRDWTVETSGTRGAGPRIPPWKMAWSDIPMDAAMRSLGMAHWGMFLFLLVRCDADGVFWAAPGRTVVETVEVCIPAVDAGHAERLIGDMVDVQLVELDESGAWVRFRPEAWARRQTVARVHAAAPAVKTPGVVPEATVGGFEAVRGSTERTDRCRFRKAALDLAAGRTLDARTARFAHAQGTTFEAWLLADGAEFLAERRRHNPHYAFGVGAAGAVGSAEVPAAPASRTASRASQTASREAGSAEVPASRAASPIRSEKNTGKETEGYREDRTPEAREAASRFPLPASRFPEAAATLPASRASSTEPAPGASADGQRVPAGAHTVLLALIDRANARTEGNLQDRILAAAASSDAYRLAAWRLHDAGITAEDAAPSADPSRRGKQILDELVALVRSESAVKRVLGKWKEVQAAGYRLPLQAAAHRDGLIVTQLCAEAHNRIDAKAPTLPFSGAAPKGRAPVSAHAQHPADGREVARIYRSINGKLVLQREVAEGVVRASADPTPEPMTVAAGVSR
jgi:hypothetical protein